MTTTSLERIVERVRSIAVDHDYRIERLVIFGSYAGGSPTPESDVDVLLVSPDFDGIDFYARPHHFYWNWDTDLPRPDLIPLTPDEFDARSADPTDIVHEAVESGRDVTPASV